MKTTRPDEPFAERVERLKQELALALQWDRPSILLAVYSSMFVRADAEAVLEAWLHEQGQTVARVQVTSPDDPAADVPLALREWSDRAHTVFFVSGLRQGAPTTWNALNVRREYLVDGRTRVVFWVTEGEAAELPQRAPDFWAFRHRVVEFVEPPEVSRAVHLTGALSWVPFFEEWLPPKERQARIAFREDLLSELPDAPETAAARAQLHYTLGVLHSLGREYEVALGHVQAARTLSEQTGDVTLQVRVLNALGNVYYQQSQYEKAIAAYQQAVALDPKLAYLHNGLGNVYDELGRHEEAVAAYQQAIILDPNLAAPYNGLGHVYSELGQYEEAVAAYRRAVKLDPGNVASYVRLAGGYRHIGDANAQARYIAEARRLLQADDDYNQACLESIAGNVDAALEHLAKALEKVPGNRDWARVDPDLAFIRDDPRFQELVGEDRG